jgi:drug/metabolite transporter (DMT)-like permease
LNPISRLARHARAPDAVLILCTAVWGLAFLVAHEAVARVPPFPFVALRFAMAALAVQALTGARLRRVTRAERRGGVLIALAMLAGYGLQAAALTRLGSGRVAFICATYVPLVPLVQAVLWRRLPPPAVWLSVGLATAGMMLLAGGAGGTFGPSEALALASACGIAAEILLVSAFAPHVAPRQLALVQCIAVSAMAAVLALLTGQSLPPIQPLWIACTLGLGLASAALQLGVNWAMRLVPATRATVIFATEPVWAAAFGALAGERLGLLGLAGGGLILTGLLVNPRPPAAPTA